VPGSQRRADNQDDLGHALDIAALLPELPGMAEPAAAVVRQVTEPASMTPETEAATPPAPASLQDRLNRLRAAAKARLDGTSPSPALQNGMQAFCRGAGIDIEKLPFTSDAEALQLVGRMLREALLGLKDLQRAQQVFAVRYGITADTAEGPALGDLGSDDYLLELLAGHEKRRLDAVLRLRDEFAGVTRHANAVDPALRSALALFIGHLDPARMDGLPAETRWTRYRELYASLLRSGAGDAPPHLFVEALAQAFLDAQKA
jgi:predicted component of type VI protein secretion system